MRLHRKRGALAWDVLAQFAPAFAPRASKSERPRKQTHRQMQLAGQSEIVGSRFNTLRKSLTTQIVDQRVMQEDRSIQNSDAPRSSNRCTVLGATADRCIRFRNVPDLVLFTVSEKEAYRGMEIHSFVDSSRRPGLRQPDGQ